MGAALGADPLEFILGGGDDHALLATFPDAASVPGGLAGGRRGRARATGVTVDGAAYDGPTGWTALLSWIAADRGLVTGDDVQAHEAGTDGDGLGCDAGAERVSG